MGLGLSTLSVAASFDCSEARTTVEKMICGNKELSRLDSLLADTFKRTLNNKQPAESEALIKDQRRWLKTVRNRCMDEACLSKTMHDRINDLDPVADGILTCEKMRKYSSKVFSPDGIDLGSGFGSPVDVDYRCPDSLASLPFMQKILTTAEEIRAEGWSQPCTGSIIHALWRYYQFDLTMAGMAPRAFAAQKKLEMYPRDVLGYFTQWGEMSPYNYKLYQDFMHEYEHDREELSKLYQTKFGLPRDIAHSIAKQALDSVLDRAAGSYPHDSYHPSSGIVKLAEDPKTSIGQLQNAIAGKERFYMKSELYKALQTALLHNRSPEFIKLLATQFAVDDFSELDRQNEPLLAFAVGNIENLRILLSFHFPVESQNDFGKTALFYAIGANDYASTELLLQHHAEVNHTYKSSAELTPTNDEEIENMCVYSQLQHTRRSPLMHAAQHSNVDMLKLLLSHGADLKATDDLGFNAMDYAAMGHNMENEAYLKSLGLDFGAPAHPTN